MCDRVPYPRNPRLSLNSAGNAAVLQLCPTDEIDEPVLVLAGSDPISTPNYYHWMVFQLTRAVWAWRQGWLDERRLLIATASRPWMFEALRLAGIPESRWLLQPPGRAFGCATLGWCQALSIRAPPWCELRGSSSGGVPASSEHNPPIVWYFWGVRRSRRPVFALRELLSVVQAAGFEFVDPGELSIADQVRLLASARGIAGFGGAAMTNLMFAREGVRVLDLTSEAVQWPEFSGISIALGQHYRYFHARFTRHAG